MLPELRLLSDTALLQQVQSITGLFDHEGLLMKIARGGIFTILILSKRMGREAFEDYLRTGCETESKRCFLRRILRGNEAFQAALPGHLKSLAERAA